MAPKANNQVKKDIWRYMLAPSKFIRKVKAELSEQGNAAAEYQNEHYPDTFFPSLIMASAIFVDDDLNNYDAIFVNKVGPNHDGFATLDLIRFDQASNVYGIFRYHMPCTYAFSKDAIKQYGFVKLAINIDNNDDAFVYTFPASDYLLINPKLVGSKATTRSKLSLDLVNTKVVISSTIKGKSPSSISFSTTSDEISRLDKRIKYLNSKF